MFQFFLRFLKRNTPDLILSIYIWEKKKNPPPTREHSHYYYLFSHFCFTYDDYHKHFQQQFVLPSHVMLILNTIFDKIYSFCNEHNNYIRSNRGRREKNINDGEFEVFKEILYVNTYPHLFLCFIFKYSVFLCLYLLPFHEAGHITNHLMP